MIAAKNKATAFDLWDAAAACIANPASGDDIVKPKPRTIQKHLIVVGGKSGGKSTMIQRYLDISNKEPRETIGVGYSYVKNQRENNLQTDVGNIWEIGSSVYLSELLASTVANLPMQELMVFVVLDLSKPEKISSTLEHCLFGLRKALSKQRSQVKPESFFGVPLWIIGSKADELQKMNLGLEKRQVIFQALQQCSGFLGAGLMYVSSAQQLGDARVKALLRNWFFGDDLSEKDAQSDVTKLVYLFPKGGNVSGLALNSDTMLRSELDTAKMSLLQHFRQTDSDEFLMPAKDAESDSYKEKPIDDIYAEAQREFAAKTQGNKRL